MDQSDKLFRYSFFLFFPLFLFFHYDLIINDPVLLRDDVLLLSTVDSVESFKDYFDKLLEGIFYDIQPIRDLSFYLNLKIYNATGFGGFHLTNVFLTIGILFLARKGLRNFGFDDKSIFIALLVLAAHPVLNSSTAWISNRKHLLSVCFILFYLLELQKKKVSGLKLNIWALFSFLSQPITIFIPPGYVIYKKLIKKQLIEGWDYLLLGISLIILGINYYFYNTNIRFLGRNEAAEDFETGLYILKMGRVAVQILFPFRLAIEYDPGSYLNLVGIALFVIVVFVFYKSNPRKELTLFTLLALTSLFPVLNWGARDPYLLISLLVCSYFLARHLNTFFYSRTNFLLIPYFLFLSFYSVKYTDMWRHDMTLHRVSYETEGGVDNLVRYANMLSIYEPSRAHGIISEILENFPSMASPLLYSRKAETLYNDPNLSDEEKLRKFKENPNPDIFEVFFEAKLRESLNNEVEAKNAWKALKDALKNPEYAKSFKSIVCLNYPSDCKRQGIEF